MTTNGDSIDVVSRYREAWPSYYDSLASELASYSYLRVAAEAPHIVRARVLENGDGGKPRAAEQRSGRVRLAILEDLIDPPQFAIGDTIAVDLSIRERFTSFQKPSFDVGAEVIVCLERLPDDNLAVFRGLYGVRHVRGDSAVIETANWNSWPNVSRKAAVSVQELRAAIDAIRE